MSIELWLLAATAVLLLLALATDLAPVRVMRRLPRWTPALLVGGAIPCAIALWVVPWL
ncbi:hypothetical protein [Sciscionella marina]|uniref:hypothetical protein n=1 Tax=Sciscionella marina TaxID=508770 RepID=UPI00036E94A6|nr:hypothetical protein [Sciscionella marina]